MCMCPVHDCDKYRKLQEEHEKTLAEVAHLKNRIAWFERQTFGQKTERFISDDTQLQLDLGQPIQNSSSEVQQNINYSRRAPQTNKTPHGRDEIPAHIPRERVVVKPDFDTTGMEKIGEKITEELHYTPPVFKALQLVREVFVAEVNGEKTVMCAGMPPRCIDKGKAGPSVVAHIIAEKCVDHIPLNRTCERIKRVCGMEVSQSTVNGWFERGAFWLETLATEIMSTPF